jgi:D-lactate dehydrogenase
MLSSKTNDLSPKPLPAEWIETLSSTFPPERFFTDPSDCLVYGQDNSRRLVCPGAVVQPENTNEVVKVVTLCNRFGIPFIARGRGTATTGAAVPPKGGVVISTEKMNRILSVQPQDRYAVVQPGVINQVLQDNLLPDQLFWPPDPSSQAFSSIGGNLALNSAGPLAVKYGTPRENTLALEAVTASGKVIRTGSLCSKTSIGYDLTRLLIGSEGTLAIITEATLKLSPRPTDRVLISAWYDSIQHAASAVSSIMAQPLIPCALECMDSSTLNILREHTSLDIPSAARAMLMIELDGEPEALKHQQERLSDTARNSGCLVIQCATNPSEQEALKAARKALSPALRTLSPKKINEDVVVPVSKIPALIEAIESMSQRHSVRIVSFGHAGNGNLHTNLLIDPNHPEEIQAAQSCLDELFKTVLSLGGALSGEHGIGLEKRPFMALQYSPETLLLMQQIKSVFDPLSLLNPGKLLPDNT